MEKSEIIVNDFPRSPISESFRLFRTNLLYLFEIGRASCRERV